MLRLSYNRQPRREPAYTAVGRACSQRRFSLPDLVVLLTILVAILAMVLPAIYGALQQAKSVTCQANLKNIATWSGMYAAENEYYLPPYESGWVAPLAELSGARISPTVAPSKDFACPAQPLASPISGVTPTAYWRGTNYGINQHLASNLTRLGDTRFPEWSSVSIRSFGDAARKVTFADSSGSNYFDTPDLDPAVAGISRFGGSYVDAILPDPARPLPSLRHRDGTANFLFADGHIETKDSFPMFMNGRGTGGYEFWHAEHWYPESGLEPPEEEESDDD
jgi:prepilin-type processing-associated H-X9-DG protein